MGTRSRIFSSGQVSMWRERSVIVNSESLYETKPLVTVKGTRDGLLFLLDEQSDVADLCIYISELLSGQSGKVFDGPIVEVVVDYGKRVLTTEDARRLLGIFMERPNFLVKGWGGGTVTRQSLFHRKSVSRGQNIYHGLVRAGEPITFDGDVVVIGDVNPSAEIRATGDIYVFGRLSGIAHAGVDGDRDSVIAATEFAPMQLRIADVVSRAPQLKAVMEYAYLEHGQLAIAEMRHFIAFDKSRIRPIEHRQKGN